MAGEGRVGANVAECVQADSAKIDSSTSTRIDKVLEGGAIGPPEHCRKLPVLPYSVSLLPGPPYIAACEPFHTVNSESVINRWAL